MDILLRPAGVGDLTGVGTLHHRSRVAAYQDFIPMDALTMFPAEALESWWTERWSYERDTHLLTVAERDGRLVGFTYVGPYQDPDADEVTSTAAPDESGTPVAEHAGLGELYAIHLDPAEQGRGTGRILMRDALTKLHQRGWREAGLWVYAENARARRFYERGGWRHHGVERDGMVGSFVARQLYYRRPLP